MQLSWDLGPAGTLNTHICCSNYLTGTAWMGHAGLCMCMCNACGKVMSTVNHGSSILQGHKTVGTSPDVPIFETTWQHQHPAAPHSSQVYASCNKRRVAATAPRPFNQAHINPQGQAGSSRTKFWA